MKGALLNSFSTFSSPVSHFGARITMSDRAIAKGLFLSVCPSVRLSHS